MISKLRIGTRSSELALIQTEIVAEKIHGQFPHIEIEIRPMKTVADRHLNRALSDFGGQGAFTKELEEGLLCGTIDIAVHSAKDMALDLPAGLMVGGVLPRADVRDILVTKDGTPLSCLRPGTVIGTGSLRREIQLLAANPNVIVRPIRGNVQTRLRKLAEGNYDGVVLAAAGLKRLNYQGQPKKLVFCKNMAASEFDYGQFQYELLDTEKMLPAPGQGILAVEARKDDEALLEILTAVSDKGTRKVLEAEQSFLRSMGSACNAPAAALAQIQGDIMYMEAMYAPEERQTIRRITMKKDTDNGVVLGREVAEVLLANENAKWQRCCPLTRM